MRGWGAESSAGGRAAGEGGIQKFKHRAACRGAFHRRAACCLKLWLRGRPGRQLCTGPKDHRFLRSAAGAGKTGGPAFRSALTCPKVATIIITGAGRKTGAAGSRRLPKGWHCAAGDSSRCIAALRRRYYRKAGQSLALCSAGDDLRAKSRHFVLCTPKRRLRAAVLASSRKPCAAARLRGGRKRPLYMVAGSGRRYTSVSPPAGPAGGPMKSSAPTQGAALHSHHPPTMPAVPDPSARLPCIVGRAFTPAGKVCGGPEGYWQGQVRHPSVG